MTGLKWVGLSLLLVLGVGVRAQDIQTEMALFGNVSDAFVYTQQAASGGFQPNADGTWQLRLDGIAPEIDLFDVDGVSKQTFQTADLIADWNDSIATAPADQSNAELNPFYAQGDLTTAEFTAQVLIQGATYDAATGSLVYTVTLLIYIPTADVSGQPFNAAFVPVVNKDVAAEFGVAALSIKGSNALLDTLKLAALSRLSALRPATTVECQTAATQIRSSTTTLNDLYSQLTLNQRTLSKDDLDALLSQISTVRQQVYYARTWFNANCQARRR